MKLVLDILLLAIALVVLCPVAVFAAECVLALLWSEPRPSAGQTPRPRACVVVPAHDEDAGIGANVAALREQLAGTDRLVVVADNCSDHTAEAAQAAGAVVVERQDSQHRGKWFALLHGLKYLEADPPEVVVIVDADCQLPAGALDALARAAATSGRPAQAIYLMDPPRPPTARDCVSALAFLVKNEVRPLGLRLLGLPCPLTGSGMALPWPLLRQSTLAGDDLVEDMHLGIDLAIAGHPPLLCTEATVRSSLPQSGQASFSQRTRWEHGHIGTILKQCPRLLAGAFRQRSFTLLAMAVDLSIPPLSLLVLLWLVATALAIAGRLAGLWLLPAALLAAGGVLMFASVLAAWARFGRSRVPAKALLAVPLYVLWKIPLYLAFAFRRQRTWVRTERTNE